jgi:hypothetical protein
MPSAPTLRLELRRSRLQRVLAVLLLAGSVLALVLAPWPHWLRAAAVIALLAVSVLLVRRPGAGAAGLEWRADGSWWLLVDDDGQGGAPTARPLRLRSARAIGPLLALRFSTGSGRLPIDLWPDSADPDDLRRLRIRLQRTQIDTATPGADPG